MTIERTLRELAGGFVLLSLALAGAARAADAPKAEDLMTRSQRAFHYAGSDMRAKVRMDLVDKKGRTRTRVLTMLRRNEGDGGDQKFFLFFHEPGDMRGTAFLVWKYAAKEDDRWIFVPAVDLVRRIAADDKRSSFVGSDFTYEEISGRDVASDAHKILREEKLGGRNCYVVESQPLLPSDHARRISWIDEENALPLREEYLDTRGEKLRIFTADKVEEVAVGEGAARKVYPTATVRTMEDLKAGHKTVVTFSATAYDAGIDAEVFTERALRQPPRKWIE